MAPEKQPNADRNPKSHRSFFQHGDVDAIPLALIDKSPAFFPPTCSGNQVPMHTSIRSQRGTERKTHNSSKERPQHHIPQEAHDSDSDSDTHTLHLAEWFDHITPESREQSRWQWSTKSHIDSTQCPSGTTPMTITKRTDTTNRHNT